MALSIFYICLILLRKVVFFSKQNRQCMMSVALVTQHAKRTRCVILSPVACLALPYFPHYLTNSTIFRMKLLNIKCVFLFSVICLKYSKKNSAR